MADMREKKERGSREDPLAYGTPPQVNIEGTEDDDEEEDEDELDDDDDETVEDEEEEVDEATKREAMHFWGQMFDPDKRCTELCDRLFSAIARYIVSTSRPSEESNMV
jgi:hypothetical protein